MIGKFSRSLITAAMMLLLSCSDSSMHHLFDFGKEKDVYLQLDLDLNIPGFEDALADSPGETYALQASLIRQGQDELPINMRFKGGTSAASIPVSLTSFQQSINTILEVPLSEPVDPNLGTWVFRFIVTPSTDQAGLHLKKTRLADESGEEEPLSFSTIETRITFGNNLAAINYRSTVVAKIMDATGVSTLSESLSGQTLATIQSNIDVTVKDKLATIKAPVSKDTVSSHFTAGKMTDILTPVLRYIEYVIATDTTLQDAIAPSIAESTGVPTSQILSRYSTSYIVSSVSNMSQIVNNTTYSSMRSVITTDYITEASIPSQGESVTTTWTPKNLMFTDLLSTANIQGDLIITHPANTQGLYGFAIYAGGNTSTQGKLHFIGDVSLNATGTATTFALPSTALATGETWFWVYPLVDVADSTTPHGRQELNYPYGKQIDNATLTCSAGQYLTNGSCAAVGAGYWSDGTNNNRNICSNAPTYASYTDISASSATCAWSCNNTFTASGASCVCPAGKYAVSGSCTNVTIGYWSDGSGITRNSCSNLPANAVYSNAAATSSNCAWTCNSGYSSNGTSCVAATCSIAGTVVSAQTGIAIDGTASSGVVSVVSQSTSGSIAANGTFNLSVPCGSLSLRYSATGYDTQDVAYTLSSSQNLTNQTVTLLPSGYGSDSLVVVLTWGASPSDLDTHVLMNAVPSESISASHFYYGNLNSNNATPFVSIDVDDTSSYGPETTVIKKKTGSSNLKYSDNGSAEFWIYDYNQSGFGPDDAVVKIFSNGTLVKTYTMPATASHNWWHVFDVTSNGSITDINTTAASPTSGITAD